MERYVQPIGARFNGEHVRLLAQIDVTDRVRVAESDHVLVDSLSDRT